MLRLTVAALMLLGAGVRADVHVSTAGSDANPGTADRPVATLSRAVEMSRQQKDRRIVVQPGEYHDVAITLGAQDSGLVMEAADAAKRPVLLGGVPLTDWRKEGKFAVAQLAAGPQWDVRMLQVNGKFRPRARYPREGTLEHLTRFDVPWMSTTGGGWKRKPTKDELTTMKYKAGDLPADLSIRNAEVTVFHMWDESVSGIAEHDAATQTLKLAPDLGHPPGAFGVRKYVLWNLEQGMSEPGQWYFDREKKRIVYWPMADEDMSRASVIVPTQNTIVRLAGAKDITIRNLSFGVTTVPLTTGGFAAGGYPACIQVEKSATCTLSNLAITNVGGHGIKARGTGLRIENCEVTSCGAGGIYVNGENATIHNNLIAYVGLAYPSAIGINGGGKNGRISHNEIHDTPYSAMDYGGENTVIEDNLISRCMLVLHDGGAIYVFGGKNTILRRNVARDIPDTGGYGSSSYYLDEQCQNCIVEGNLSVNVQRPSHNHMARNNTIRNNVFVTDGDMRITFPRCSDYTLSGNILLAGGKITFEGINNVATWSKNIMYSKAGKIEGVNLKDYSGTGSAEAVRGDTIVADPMFVNVAKGDYRLRADSPAGKLGIPSLDVSGAGRVRQR